MEFLSTIKKNWYKVDNEFIVNAGENINWGYSTSNLSVESMWTEIYSKMQSISDKVPDLILKTNKVGDILQKLPWDS